MFYKTLLGTVFIVFIYPHLWSDFYFFEISLQSVFVSWSPDCQYPFDIEFIQSQIVLLTHLNADLPETSLVSNESSWWVRLRNTWFLTNGDSSNTNGSNLSYRMPELSPFSCSENIIDGFSKQAEQEIWFTTASCDSLPQLKLSIGLRSRLILTNQIPLVFGGKWFYESFDFKRRWFRNFETLLYMSLPISLFQHNISINIPSIL